MAKRKAATRTKSRKTVRKVSPAHRSAKRPTAKRPTAKRQATLHARAPKRAPAKAKKAPAKIARKTAVPARRAATKTQAKAPVRPVKVPRLDRARRMLDESETLQTPPSSLDMDRHGSAARRGRAGMEHTLRDHEGMSSDIAAGDVDVDVEDAYFTGDDSPGGDNQTPDQDRVDDIGKALGVEYDDNEPLKGSDKVTERDTHRWELDPASAEDYKDRK
jgi:hypothetical protein